MRELERRERYHRWWFDDFPPLHGALRFIFYTGLLGLAFLHPKSPVLAIERYKATHPDLFEPFGLIGLLQVPYLSVTLLQSLIWVTIAAWICAAIGVVSRTSAIVTAAGFTFLHGYFDSVNAFDDAWYLPMYCLVLLCFARTDDLWSVDGLVRRMLGKKKEEEEKQSFTEFLDFAGEIEGFGGEGIQEVEVEEREKTKRTLMAKKLADARKLIEGDTRIPGSVLGTGFARKGILVLTAGLFVSAGISKLMVGGWRWLDGNSLRYWFDETPRWLPDVLEDYGWVCVTISILVVVFQLGSISALLTRRTRAVLLVGWISSGVFLYSTVGKWDWASTWCLILLVEWKSLAWKTRDYVRLGVRLWTAQHADDVLDSLGMRVRWQFIQRLEIMTGSSTGTCLPNCQRSRAQEVAVVAGSSLLALLALTTAFQIQWWPLTPSDQLSAYYTAKEIRAGFHRSEYLERDKVQALATRLAQGKGSSHAAGYLARCVELWLVPHAGGRQLRLSSGVGVSDDDQWVATLMAPVIVADLAEKPVGSIGRDPDFPRPAYKFLIRLLPVLRETVPDIVKYKKVQVVYLSEEGSVILAEAEF